MRFARTPEDLHDLFMDGVNNKDVDALIALYEPNSLVIGLDGSRVEGEVDLRAALTDFVTAVDHLDGTIRKVIVHGDYALLSSTFTAHPGAATDISGEVARRQPDGSWRFFIDDPAFGSAN